MQLRFTRDYVAQIEPACGAWFPGQKMFEKFKKGKIIHPIFWMKSEAGDGMDFHLENRSLQNVPSDAYETVVSTEPPAVSPS